MDIEKCRYIVVEGPIGAGKTSLARTLADRARRRHPARGARRESVSAPDSTKTCAASRCRRSSISCSSASTSFGALAQLDMFARHTVADFLLDKDPLFARLNLSDDEFALYDKVYSHLKLQTPTPDLVIYLQAPVTTLIERVHQARRRLRAGDIGALSGAAGRRLQPLFLPVLRRAAPDRQQRASEFRRRSRALAAAARPHRRDARSARVLQPRRELSAVVRSRSSHRRPFIRIFAAPSSAAMPAHCLRSPGRRPARRPRSSGSLRTRSTAPRRSPVSPPPCRRREPRRCASTR